MYDLLKVGRGGSKSQVSLRVQGGEKTLNCYFRLCKIIFFDKKDSSEFSQTPGSDAQLKKESIALFFIILRVHFTAGQIFGGKVSHFINFENLACGNPSVGS